MGNSKAKWRIGGPTPTIEPHTLAKHRIVRRYIQRYIEIVTRNRRMDTLRITFVDGYSGGGRYTNGQESFPGSPMIFLSTVAEMESQIAAGRTKGFNIQARYIFIDNERRHTDYLRAEIESSAFRGLLDKEISIWTGDFNVLVDSAIAAVKQNSTKAGCSIFLLDQFGWSQVSLLSIRKILSSLQKSEVFLTFMVDALATYLADNKYDMSAFSRIDLPPEMVRDMLRFREEDYLGARVLIQNFMYDHIRKQTSAPYYSPFMIKSRESNRSHWFLHLSKHHEARNEIGEIHWQENNTTTHHGRPTFGSLGFTASERLDQYMIESFLDDHARNLSLTTFREEIPSLIGEATAVGRPANLIELFGKRSSDSPLVRSIVDPVLLELRDEGEVVIRRQDGTERPRTKTLDWTDSYELTKSPRFWTRFPLR
jgi:three-Cys-motif partner protein